MDIVSLLAFAGLGASAQLGYTLIRGAMAKKPLAPPTKEDWSEPQDVSRGTVSLDDLKRQIAQTKAEARPAEPDPEFVRRMKETQDRIEHTRKRRLFLDSTKALIKPYEEKPFKFDFYEPSQIRELSLIKHPDLSAFWSSPDRTTHLFMIYDHKDKKPRIFKASSFVARQMYLHLNDQPDAANPFDAMRFVITNTQHGYAVLPSERRPLANTPEEAAEIINQAVNLSKLLA